MTPDLPIVDILPELRRTLASCPAAVLEAPPGAGKTTVVPLALVDEPWMAGRSILMLEPRRLAARAACARMAALRGESVGGTVGYRIRFESRVSPNTRIEVLTEGILARRLQADPALEGVGLVIFDEFHERHLHGDLALALCLDVQHGLRPDLRLLVMSATLDGAAVAALLGGAPRLASSGRIFPVAIRYLDREPQEPLPIVVGRAVRQALRDVEGDVLAFLPGAPEIRRAQAWLVPELDAGVDVLPLYGDLPGEAQDRALRPSPPGRRKVVLATTIAETSLTIEGVRVVVDGGYARVAAFDAGTGLSRRVTVRVSRAQAEQRAGRAGRLGPGLCWRLWTESTQRGLVTHTAPEIRNADLTPLALELAAWGVRDAGQLRWLDPPPGPALTRARALLLDLGAIDDRGVLTETGRAMAALPLHPRLAHMLRWGQLADLAGAACDVAALLSERDVVAPGSERSCDLHQRLEALQAFRERGAPGARSGGADPAACARAEQAARQYRRWLRAAEPAAPIHGGQLGALLAAAYPDRVAVRRESGEGRYLLASGRGARLPPADRHREWPWIVAASLDAGATEGTVYLAAPVALEALRGVLAHRLRAQDVVRWDALEQAVVARREERLGELVLSADRLADPDPQERTAAMLEGIRRMGLACLPWTPELRAWQARVLSLRAVFPQDGWPDVSDDALLADLEHWLAPYLGGASRRGHLDSLDVGAALRTRLDGDQARRLEEGAPAHITVPSGSRLKLEYAPGGPPVLAVKLQEMFGLGDTPRVGWGRIPVMLHLLSPARRPIQVTQDLRGFWERTYREVRKELKGRYPKHPWPEDPWTAPPTARARRRPSSGRGARGGGRGASDL